MALFPIKSKDVIGRLRNQNRCGLDQPWIVFMTFTKSNGNETLSGTNLHLYDLCPSTWTHESYINIHRLKWSQVDTHKTFSVVCIKNLTWQ